MTPEEKQAFVDAVVLAVRESVVPTAHLTDDERRWVRMAIKKEAQTLAFRQSVIDKTLTGLVWAALIGMFTMFVQWLQLHGWKS
jgi:hypothetical protein